MNAKQILKSYDKAYSVKSKDMKNFFLEKSAGGNPVIYKVYVKHDKKTGMNYSLTIINAGAIGKEYFMTRGHYHMPPTIELYVLLKGKVLLLMQKGRIFKKIKMIKNKKYLVQKGYAHRIANIGNTKAHVLAVYSPKSKNIYKDIEKRGFKERILKK